MGRRKTPGTLPRERIDAFIAEVVPMARRLRAITGALIGNELHWANYLGEPDSAVCDVTSDGEVTIYGDEGLALVLALGGEVASDWYGEPPRQRDLLVVVEGVRLLAVEEEPAG